MSDEPRPCPECGFVDQHPASVRQGTGSYAGLVANIIDVGWRCRQCGHEWGFEVLTEAST